MTISCTSSSNTIKGSASIAITIETTPLVCVTDKSGQEISDEKNLKLSAARSYDPDLDSLSYSYAVAGKTDGETSNALTVSKHTLRNLDTSSLVVLLTVTRTDSRTCFKSHLFTIQKSNKLSISVLGPDKKLATTSSVTLKSRASSTNSGNVNMIAYI